MAALRRHYWSRGYALLAFIVKTYRSDPPQRPGFSRLLRRWVTAQLSEVSRALRGGDVPLALLGAEFQGGLRGLVRGAMTPVKQFPR
jgi:hypothetical protein